MYKRIIFESPDNCGKDTQIRLLSTRFAKQMTPYHVLHYSAIPGITPEESKAYSMCLYRDMFRLILHETAEVDRTLILNRSHIGENVYAPMYRNTDGEWIFLIEKHFKMAYPYKWDDLYLITFVDDPENLIKRDDGLSFSVDLDKKASEIGRFITTTKQSNIVNKIIINIRNKDQHRVHEEVLNFLNME